MGASQTLVSFAHCTLRVIKAVDMNYNSAGMWEKLPLHYYDHVRDCGVQCVNGTRSLKHCITVCKIHKCLEMWFILCMWQCPTDFTICNGTQTWIIILWWTGWCNTLSSSDGVVRWGISACSTRCTSVPLRRVGPLLPPLSLMSPPSKHGWGPPGGTSNIYRGCGKGAGRQVEHLVVWEEGVLWRQEDWWRIWSRQCLQNLPTSQPTQSILVAQLCILIEVLTYLLCFGGVYGRSTKSMLLSH